MGPDTIVWTNVGQTTISARMVGEFSGSAGDEILLGLDLANASYFDQSTGVRL
jgi:hypothetical protein